MLIVTGGNDGQVDLDSTEVLDFNYGSWRSLQWLSVIISFCKIWSDLLKRNCNQCNAAMIMPGMHRVCPQPLLVSQALCWTGFSTSLAAGRCNEHLSTSFFFPSFDNKTTDGKSVLFSVCVFVSSSADKSMTTSFTMCLLLFTCMQGLLLES